MIKDFILELGCEEIPALMIGDAIADIEKILATLLAESCLPYESFQIFAAPRRLTALIKNLEDKQPDSGMTIVGPPKDAAFLHDGTPGKAALGFARAQGVDVEKLKFTERNGKEFLTVTRVNRGKKATEILPDLFRKLFSSLNFPKMMRWGDGTFRFVRPVRSLLALYGKQRVKMELFGIKSSSHTFSHRVLNDKRIKVESPEDYLELLKENMVLADHRERKKLIDEMLQREASHCGAELKRDESLEEEVAFMVEYPSVSSGQFSSHFLELPGEILVTTLRHHQKCFSLKEGEKIANKFLAVVDHKPEAAPKILKRIEGNVTGRLRDAEFYWNEDRKRPLEERVDLLKGVQFHEKLGSYHEKVRRMAKLASTLYDMAGLGPHGAGAADSESAGSCSKVDNAAGISPTAMEALHSKIEKAAILSKVDLTTEMVGDFPELQGIMGGIYASREGMPDDVSRAIYEHYLPVSITDESPSTTLGAVLSISDKMDSIIGCFGIGLIPSGSRDPFALRRAAQGILKVCLDKKIHLRLEKLIEAGVRNYRDVSIALDETGLSAKLMEYFRERMKFFFESMGNAYDTVNAALASCDNDPFDVALRINALTGIRGHKDFEALAVSHKRIRNIISGLEKGEVREDLLKESEEIELYKSYRSVSEKVDLFTSGKKYLEALREIATLRGRVDDFFDHVLVMTEDPEVRRNRVALLYSLSDLFMTIADFSEIVVAGL